ncbi:MAG: hypothetical protein JW942_05645 [Opitutales bacterium]|nr:hypothetical protein [Opitutales bacterium]
MKLIYTGIFLFTLLYVGRNLLTGGRQTTLYFVYMLTAIAIMDSRGRWSNIYHFYKKFLPALLLVIGAMAFFVYNYSAYRVSYYTSAQIVSGTNLRYGMFIFDNLPTQASSGIINLFYYFSHQMGRLDDFFEFWLTQGELFSLRPTTFKWIFEQINEYLHTDIRVDYRWELKAGGMNSYGWQTGLATLVLDYGFIGAQFFIFASSALLGRITHKALCTHSLTYTVAFLYFGYAVWTMFMGPMIRYEFVMSTFLVLVFRLLEVKIKLPTRDLISEQGHAEQLSSLSNTIAAEPRFVR